MFYDVTTLYFETDRQDDLRKTGFSKEGRHSNPQIVLGLLVSLEGYPLAYCIHEGHTMLPVIREFVTAMADIFGFDEQDVFDAVINKSEELAHVCDLYRLKMAS